MSQKAAGERTLWGIHGGKTGDADNLFLKHGVIALGWVEMGDMSRLAADREAFKARLQELRPDRKPGYYPIKNYADEFLAALSGQATTPSAREDETVSYVTRVYVPEPLEDPET